MAEAAGLVLGVVGLAGVISAFKDAVDLFNDFTDSRDLGRDYEILDSKIDIEKTILLQWADHVKLLRPDCDSRLLEANTQQAVARILACIRLLMSDESELKHHYGLSEAKEQQVTDEIVRVPTISGLRMAKFIQEFEALMLRRNLCNQSISLQKRVRWIIRDKRKFENLVKELAHFTTKLTQVVPIFHSQTSTQSMINQDVADIGGLRELKIVHDASIGHRTAIAESTQQYITRACQDRILRILWFRSMNDRKESISTAHNKTLHWPLEPPIGEFPWDDLSKWLQFDSGIYWISGKAGSGKSTLMKHIYHQQKTRQLLSQWAGDARCSLIDFFFWNLGTTEQKSQEGLSRALLYQILSNNPSLIADALPNMWKQLYDTDGHASLPSAAETRYAFQVLATRSSDIGKFCFFIDGLDEFVGNHLDGIAFIKELAVNTHIKIVVSSRPIPDCVTSFHGLPTLQLHHLTRGDITSYVQDIVGGHQYMQGLISRHPEEAIEIMEDVVTKSSGVFLWVILACRSLLSGFSDYDRISELRRRVDELPPELEEMFQHMLGRINKRHREQGARMLRICCATRHAQDTREVGDMSSLGLALMDDDSISADQISVLTTDQKRRLCDELDGRLRSRCGGLLELELKHGTPHCFCEAAKGDIHDAQIDGTVVFMHRTVFEFLSNEQTWELECLEAPDGFEVATDLSIVGLYSAILSLPWREKQATDFLRDGMNWGAQSDRHDPDGESNIFWVMQPFLDSLSPLALSDGDTLHRLARFNKHNLSPASSHATLILAIEAGAANYARQHPEFTQLAQSTAHICGCLPLLYHAVALPLMDGNVKKWGRGKDQMGFLSNAMATLLLSYGGDPNYVIHDEEGEVTTPWAIWLHSTHRIMLDDTDQLEIAEIAFTFLSFGADLLEDLREWVVKQFKRRRSDPVRKAANGLLQFIGELKQKTGICSVSGLNVQTTANKDDHNTSRMPMESPSCSGVHVSSSSQMKRKTAISMFPVRDAKRICTSDQ